MCGRSACSRDPDKIRHACAYRPRGRKKAVKPKWVSCNSQKYYPSYNVSPQTNTPVLLSSQHKHIQKAISESSADCPTDERVLQLMKWGLVPSWHKGDPKKPPTLLNNCRFEGMLEKPSFRSAIQRRQRCVVLADGFFEWNRSTSHKQPYFIFFTDCGPTEEMKELSSSCETQKMEAEQEETDASAGKESEGAAGKSDAGGEGGGIGLASSQQTSAELDLDQVKGRMLTMAGLFDIWNGDEEESLFTYTVITVEAHSTFAQIHHRMPAILDGDEAVRAWLDPSFSTQEVLHLVHPTTCLAWYPVSTVVNSVKNKSPECIIKIDPSEKVSSKQNTLMKWFSKSPKKESSPRESRKREEDESVCQSSSKKPKLESS